MRASVAAFALGALLALGACKDEGLKGEGETCNFSSECGEGLFCDLQASPPVCVKAGQPRDLSITPVDGSIDLSSVD